MSMLTLINWHQHLDGVLDSVTAAVLLTGAFELRNSIARFLWMVWHTTRAIASGKRFILVWNDVDPVYSIKLTAALRERFRDCRLRVIQQMSEVERYYLGPRIVSAVVIIDTDVSKLSANPKTGKRIERQLTRYLMRGGGIIGTHDLIYARVRNDNLQAAFGCAVTDFAPSPGPVEYVRTNAGKKHPMTVHLPDRFELDDREVIWGLWEKSCVVHYESTLAGGKPLLVSRENLNGRLVWMNSGDNGRSSKGGSLAGSIAEPQEQFVRMLEAALHWVCRRHHQPQRETRQIVAHRGIHSSARENTSQAFELAIQAGADYAELDVRRTKDSVLVVHHDAAIKGNEISNCRFRLLEAAADELGYKLERLEDILKLCVNRIKLDIEVKGDGFEQELLSLVRSILHDREFVVTSFSESCIGTVKRMFPDVRCGLLIGGEGRNQSFSQRIRDHFPANRILKLGVDFVAPHYGLLRFGFSKRLRSKGIPMWVWTVDDAALIPMLLNDPSVEAIVTDSPEFALAQRSQLP
jgi:glycerophosphoryl diester phosphodiesterase